MCHQLHMKKMYQFRLSIYLGISLLSPSIYAQKTISGRIVNEQKEPVTNAMVSLHKEADSTRLMNSFADSSGFFSFSDLTVNGILVKVIAMGYEEAWAKAAANERQSIEINFTLKDNYKSLDEISISSKKPLFEHKPDRTIFNVAQSITAIGGTALEAIRKAPGVWIREQDHVINLVGKSSVLVLVNDRLLMLSGEDLMAYLQAMPASDVERLEIITAPPAKYDAAGNAGLINIVLKQKNKMGINGNIRAGLERASYSKGLTGGDINFRKGRLTLFGNINYSNGANQVTERLNTAYSQQVFRVTDNYKRILKPLQYSAGLDYALHKNATLGIQWISNMANRANESKSGITVWQQMTQRLDSAMMTTGYSTSGNSNNIANLNYTWAIDTTGKKISMNANRLWFNGRRSNNFSTAHYTDAYTEPNGITSQNAAEGKQDIVITAIQADLELPYTWASLSLGGKLGFINNKSDNRFGHYRQGTYYEDTVVSNAFDYTEQVQAWYISAQKSVGKWSLQAGLRGEFTQTKGYSPSLTQTNTNHYFNLFPTAYIQYQPNEQHSWNINYGKRINRPDYRSLDPYRAYATPYHYNEGNPFLQPSYNHNTELSYTYKNSYTLSAFYQYERNHFASVWFMDTIKNVTSGLSSNFANVVRYGLNISTSLQPAAWWETQTQFSLQQESLHSDMYTAAWQTYQIWTFYGSSSHSFTLNKSKTLVAEANAWYLSRFRQDFVEIEPMASIDAGLKVLLLNKKLSVSFYASDILATQKAKGKHVVTGQTIDNYFDTRNIRLMVNYKFGNQDVKKKQERNTGIEDEKGRAK